VISSDMSPLDALMKCAQCVSLSTLVRVDSTGGVIVIIVDGTVVRFGSGYSMDMTKWSVFVSIGFHCWAFPVDCLVISHVVITYGTRPLNQISPQEQAGRLAILLLPLWIEPRIYTLLAMVVPPTNTESMYTSCTVFDATLYARVRVGVDSD
jgi:hypothetical protein